MRDFRSLKFLDLFKGLFEMAGIHYPQLRKILTIKLTMDQRKVPTVFMQPNKRKKTLDENAFMKSLWIYVLIGLVLIPFIGFGENYFFQMSIFFGIVMFIVMTSMISDFSSVLLDLRDKHILQTRPVDKRTINLAKSIHIIIYLFFLTGALTAIPLVVGLVKHGIVFIAMTLVELILADFLIVVITALVYYVILRFYDGEKLKDIINFVQIGLTVAITIGYQLLGRSISLLEMNSTFSPKWWQFFIPPIWFGAPFEWLESAKWNPIITSFSLMALLVPILALFVYYKTMPSFERNLQKLTSNSREKKRFNHFWNNWMMNILCRRKEERAFYQFAHYMIRTEREFRLKVYPSLGLAFIFPFILLLNQLQLNSFHYLVASKWYLSIYMCNLVIPNAVRMLKYSGKYKGSWIYRVTPLQNRASLYNATLKAFFVKLFLPIYFILSIIFIVIFGFRIIPDLCIVLVFSIFFTVICSNMLKGTIPFSESFEVIGQNGGIRMIGYLMLIGVFVLIHRVVLNIPYGIWIYFVGIVSSTLIIWNRALKTIWT
ncbi:MAG: hypothetical protein Q8934_01870 [Bacillota bacterium]|nr:hypothetical protein [Bacillota bacterium]